MVTIDFSTLNRLICNMVEVDERHISSYKITGDKKGATIEVVWLPEWADVEPQQTKWRIDAPAGEDVLLGNGAKPGPNQPHTNPKPHGYKGEWHMEPNTEGQ